MLTTVSMPEVPLPSETTRLTSALLRGLAQLNDEDRVVARGAGTHTNTAHQPLTAQELALTQQAPTRQA